jgi:hydroxyethylthiazole kinase-like uncharacterized protein yjeF
MPSRPLYGLVTLRAMETRDDLPAGTLMGRAGLAAANLAWQRWLSGRVAPRVAIFAGPGNNGGDGFACASELAARRVAVTLFEHPACVNAVGTDAALFRARLPANVQLVCGGLPGESARFDLVIDALLGIGLSRPAQGWLADAIMWINAQTAPVLALDLPSGLDAFTGDALDPLLCVKAEVTLTLVADKPGLHIGHGTDCCGTIVVEALGCVQQKSDPVVAGLLAPRDFATALPRWSVNVHKGSRGDVCIVGGATGMVGAALIAARAAVQAGCGRIHAALQATPPLGADPVAPEIMLRHWTDKLIGDALVVGCGMGQSAAALDLLEAALARESGLLLDADALNLLAVHPHLLERLKQRLQTAVLTPHPLEAARMLGVRVGEVQGDRLGAAAALARKSHGVVVLKGAGTVIAAPGQLAWINPTGHPILATGGTGDCLAGVIGALLANGMTPLAAAQAGVYAHGLAAQQLATQTGGARGLRSEALAHEIARVLNQLAYQ